MKTRTTNKVSTECALDSRFYWCFISLGTRQHVRHSIIVSTLSGRRLRDCSGSSTMHPGLRDARAGAAEGETITQSRGFASREFLDIRVFLVFWRASGPSKMGLYRVHRTPHKIKRWVGQEVWKTVLKKVGTNGEILGEFRQRRSKKTQFPISTLSILGQTLLWMLLAYLADSSLRHQLHPPFTGDHFDRRRTRVVNPASGCIILPSTSCLRVPCLETYSL